MLIKDADAWEARVLLDVNESFEEDRVKYDENAVKERRTANWTLIERVPDETVEDGLADLLAPPSARIVRVPAGQACPHSGRCGSSEWETCFLQMKETTTAQGSGSGIRTKYDFMMVVPRRSMLHIECDFDGNRWSSCR